jgi:hypothetical protein
MGQAHVIPRTAADAHLIQQLCLPVDAAELVDEL